MTPLAKLLSPFALVSFDGQTYKLAAWTLEVQAEYEKYFAGLAIQNLRAHRASWGAEYEDERASLRRDIDAGVYDFGSELLRAGLFRAKNFAHLTYLCLCFGHKDDPKVQITPDLVERMMKDSAVVQKVQEAMGEVNRDPNPEPPAPPAGGVG